jgi:hypothetical protein
MFTYSIARCLGRLEARRIEISDQLTSGKLLTVISQEIHLTA